MAGFAKATIVGNLGRDPETRYTPNGAMNVSFSVAVTKRFNKDGQQQEKTTWFRVTCWGKLAEIADELAQKGWLVKGKQVLVDGAIELNEYQGNDGTAKASLELRANELQLMGSRDDDGSGGGQRQQSGGDYGSHRGGTVDRSVPDYPPMDDVPF